MHRLDHVLDFDNQPVHLSAAKAAVLSAMETDLSLLVKLLGGRLGVLRHALIGVVTLSLAACVNRGGEIPYAPANFGPPDKQEAADVAYDQPLGPLDVLKVNFFRVPELSGEYQVDAKGLLDMPLVGEINVRDKTPQQFAKELEQRYSVKYLNNPEVTIRLLSSPNNSITLEGGVAAPGIYNLQGRTTLVGAIALARGIANQDANPRRVAIFRKRDGKTMAAAFDLVSIRRGEMEDPAVYPGDVVVVDSSQVRPIYRDLMMSLPILSLFTRL